MKIGTRSILFGAHQFLLHPLILAFAWWKLHGFERVKIGYASTWRELTMGMASGTVTFPVYASLWNWRLWLVFFVHDLGYWGKANMDGEEGEWHPTLGARILWDHTGEERDVWREFVLYHSRFLAKKFNAVPSALCIADKLALAITPWWLYLPMVIATGEAKEYSFHKRRDFTETKYNADPFNAEERRLASSDSMVDRVKAMQAFMRRWVEEHRDGRADTWTGAGA